MRKLILLAMIAGVLLPSMAAVGAPPIEQGAGPGLAELQTLTGKAKAAMAAGNVADATKYATLLLQGNVDTTSWNYGNVVFDGNEILGLAALKQRQTEAAKQYLLAAGATTGSPQLNSFGPDMGLAKELFAKGEHDVVVRYLDEIARFWATVPSRFKGDKRFEDMAAANAHKIEVWKKQIKAGKTPGFDLLGDPDAASAPPLIAVGEMAPDFAVTDNSGKTVHLSDYRGKTVVLDFWATWCGPCQQSLPHTNTMAMQFADKNVVVLAVNVWDSQKAFDDWLPLHTTYSGLKFVIDPTKEHGKDIATTLYHVSGIPTQFVIDSTGKIVKSLVGYSGPNDELASAITAAK